MRRAGLAVAVADAVEEVIQHAHYVTERPGGRGAVREVIELILKAQGKWDEAMSRYLV
jgi:3-deoxy-D-manno-octulosonate 8-phosphate phosphatase (KDO 8-P phosphatase)